MGTPNDPRYDPRLMPTSTQPDIYSALAGVSSALTSTVKLLERAVNDWERREEELRDAHLDLANALNRRIGDLDDRVHELESAS